MNPTESLTLVRFVRAACPQQKLDEYTPDAWHELLTDLTFGDCKAAVIALAKRQPFIAPAEIHAEVRRLRDERIRANLADPEYDRDDVAAGLTAIRKHRAALGDGHTQPTPPPAINPAGTNHIKKYMRDAARHHALPPAHPTKLQEQQ